jgi:predicted nucleic acid-binding protein
LSVNQINSYNFAQTDALFIDANIWLYIYGPQARGDKRSRNYSGILKKILKTECSIFIDVLILSEFINSYSRIKHRLQSGRSGFKSYRKSCVFKPVAKEIADAVRRILRHCECIESELTSIDMNTLLTDYESKCPDFNDQILAELCRSRSFKFVTHDGDFKDYDITILTANKSMLNNR